MRLSIGKEQWSSGINQPHESRTKIDEKRMLQVPETRVKEYTITRGQEFR